MDNTINLSIIGTRLKRAREKCKYTQAEVAEQLGIHTNSYGNFERGTERPSLIKIVQCCIIFGIQPGEILDNCSPSLQLQSLSNMKIEKAEMQELICLLNQCSSEMIHHLYIGIKAIQEETKETVGS